MALVVLTEVETGSVLATDFESVRSGPSARQHAAAQKELQFVNGSESSRYLK